MVFYEMREPSVLPAGRAVEAGRGEVDLPGVSCWGVPGACGETGGAVNERVRILPPNEPILGALPRWPIPVEEFQELREQVRQVLGLGPEVQLRAGTYIGFLRVRILRPDLAPFEWFGVGNVVITSGTRDFLERSGLTGWHAEPVIIEHAPEGTEIATLYEFVTDGRASLTASPGPMEETTCAVCGRVDRRWSAETVVLNQLQSWDGCDFVRFTEPLPWHTVFATERARAAIEEGCFGNVEFRPLSQTIEKTMEWLQSQSQE